MLKISYEVRLQCVIRSVMYFLYDRMFFSQCISCVRGASHFLLPSVKNKAHKAKIKLKHQLNKNKNVVLVRKESPTIG